MSAAVKMRRTRRGTIPSRFVFAFRRTTPRKVLTEIESRYRTYLVENMKANDDESLVRIADTDWYKEMSRRMTPGKYLRTLREAQGLTQAQLGEKVGIPASRISDYETGQRSISKSAAKRFAKALGVSPAPFI